MEVDNEAGEALIEGQTSFRYPRSRRPTCGVIMPWALAIFFFYTTCLFALPKGHIPAREAGSLENGFKTNFVSSPPEISIKIVKKRFTNDLLFNTTSQTLHNQPLDPNEITYIDEPSPAIDAEWNGLLHAQYIALEPSEAEQIPPSHRESIWYNREHNFMELSVFHNLHCLNELRLALGHGHKDSEAEGWMHQGRAHLDHCVDQIRQALMCHVDLTPVPMIPVEGAPDGAIIGNGELHTCRDLDAVLKWVEEAEGTKRLRDP